MSHRTLVLRHLSSLPRPLSALLLLLAALSAGRCIPEEPGRPASTRSAFELQLSPSNLQIAQGTAAQFSLRGIGPDGQAVDLTAKATWRVVSAAAETPQAMFAGLVALETPGRYQVVAEYDGERLGTPIEVTAAAFRALAVNPTAPKLAKGLTQQFKATASFTDGTTQDVTATATWSIRDESGSMVATLGSKGLVTARNLGKARVTARYSTGSASAVLEVTAATLQTVDVSPASASIVKGTTQSFVATGTFSDGTTQDVSKVADWIVTDVMGADVALVDGTGTATGMSAGQAKIAAEYQGKRGEATLTVTPATVTAVGVSPITASIAKGATQKFTATAQLSDGSTQEVSALCAWTSTDLSGRSVAAVDATGLARAQDAGQARIDCSYRGFFGTATLEVRPALLVGIALTPTTATVSKGTAQAFQLVASYSDGSTQDVTAAAVWTTRDLAGTSVASVGAGGVAVGQNSGLAEVKAAHLGQSALATLTVEPPRLISLSLFPTEPRVEVGKTVQFSVQGRYKDGTTQDLTRLVTYGVTDLSGSSGVAKISAGGLATGLVAGQAKITASYSGLQGETPLFVRVLGPCTVDKWCPQLAGTTVGVIRSVWAFDENNAWAVGVSSTPVLRRNGTTWSPQPSSPVFDLWGVWGTDPNNVWAVGDGGVILKWNGTTWAPQGSSTAKWYGIWGSDANNVWAVGERGAILKWNGTTWAKQTSGTSYWIYGVWASDANNVWAVGEVGTILKGNGTAWSTQASYTSSYLYSVWGSDASNVWAVGSDGMILKWTGATWVKQASGTSNHLFGIWGTDPSNAWAVGDKGTILKWNGSSWTTQASGTSSALRAVGGVDASNVWAMGDGGTILKLNP